MAQNLGRSAVVLLSPCRDATGIRRTSWWYLLMARLVLIAPTQGRMARPSWPDLIYLCIFWRSSNPFSMSAVRRGHIFDALQLCCRSFMAWCVCRLSSFS